MHDNAALPRRVRVLELLLVTLSTFGTSILLSFYLLFTHVNADEIDPTFFDIRIMERFWDTAVSLALLGYVLWRQGRSFRAIGFAFYWKDVPRSLALLLITGAASSAFQYTTQFCWHIFTGHYYEARPHNVGFLHSEMGGPRFLLLLLGAVVNPFHEELPVRAYLMTETHALLGRWRWAILVSILVQVSYHFYQGAGAAFSYLPIFAVYAVYYARAGRIWPVILAHMYLDIGAAIISALQ